MRRRSLPALAVHREGKAAPRLIALWVRKCLQGLGRLGVLATLLPLVHRRCVLMATQTRKWLSGLMVRGRHLVEWLQLVPKGLLRNVARAVVRVGALTCLLCLE